VKNKLLKKKYVKQL